MQSRKVYVSVVAEIDEEGNKRPLSVKWEDGRVYEIDKVIEVRRAFAVKVGGTAVRYTVQVLGKITFLFEDEGNGLQRAGCK